MNPLAQEAIGAILRAGLSVGAGYIVSAGIWTQADAGRYVTGASLALLCLGWSLWQKYQARRKLVTALASPVAQTEVEVKRLVARGAAPAVTTPATAVPRIELVGPGAH